MKLDYCSIGSRVRSFRKQRGWTQEKLAELSEQEPSNISHIERGATKLSLPTLVSIANALGVTADDLLCDSLPAAKNAFDKEARELLSDCTHNERKILISTLRALKINLRSNKE